MPFILFALIVLGGLCVKAGQIGRGAAAAAGAFDAVQGFRQLSDATFAVQRMSFASVAKTFWVHVVASWDGPTGRVAAITMTPLPVAGSDVDLALKRAFAQCRVHPFAGAPVPQLADVQINAAPSPVAKP